MIDELIGQKALKTPRVIDAFRKVNRENFLPDELKKFAGANQPLPIGSGQTISQPYTVAVMTEALSVNKGNKVLEVGAGSGYQAAILSVLAGSGRVFTVEIIPELYELAKRNLAGYNNVTVVAGDGSLGYQKEAPFDRILVAASAKKIPSALVSQLKEGGRLVIPVGNEMYLIEGGRRAFLGFFAFVPLTGHG